MGSFTVDDLDMLVNDMEVEGIGLTGMKGRRWPTPDAPANVFDDEDSIL